MGTGFDLLIANSYMYVFTALARLPEMGSNTSHGSCVLYSQYILVHTHSLFSSGSIQYFLYSYFLCFSRLLPSHLPCSLSADLAAPVSTKHVSGILSCILYCTLGLRTGRVRVLSWSLRVTLVFRSHLPFPSQRKHHCCYHYTHRSIIRAVIGHRCSRRPQAWPTSERNRATSRSGTRDLLVAATQSNCSSCILLHRVQNVLRHRMEVLGTCQQRDLIFRCVAIHTYMMFCVYCISGAMRVAERVRFSNTNAS